MERDHQWIVAKQIASILAENEATVTETYEIKKHVEQCLTVTLERTPPEHHDGYRIGWMHVPPRLKDDGSYCSFHSLTKNGDRKWYE